MLAAASAPQTWTPRVVSARRERSNAQSASGSEDGRPAQQMPSALQQTVRGELEREPAERGRGGRKLELAEPQIGEDARRERDEQKEKVPRDHRPPEGVQRPEREPVRPAAEDNLRLDERLEAVRIDPRRLATLELVTDEPEAIRRLQMVAGRRLPVAGRCRPRS